MNPFATLLSLLLYAAGCAQAPEKAAPETFSAEAQALLAAADEIAKEVETLRGLSFKTPVKKGLRTKDQVREWLVSKFDEEFPPEVWGPREKAYRLLGLLPVEVDLKKTALEVLTEQVGGFYDPKTKHLYVVEGFGESLGRMLLAHEITHALDDQHYDLQKNLDALGEEEDAAFAYASVVEGTATILMSRYMMKSVLQDRGGGMTLLAEVQEHDALQAKEFAKAPAYLQRGLLLAYLQGMRFLQRGVHVPLPNAKAEDLQRAFSDPPRSSEQVLHPEKYWEELTLDEPIAVSLPDLSAEFGRGWKKVDEATLGELNAAILTEEPEEEEETPDLSTAEGAMEFSLRFMNRSWTTDAAEGWGGDRYAAYAKGKEVVAVWLTAWDSVSDAKEFEKAYEPPGRPFARLRSDDRVVVAVGPLPEEALRRAAERALREAKTERPAPKRTAEKGKSESGGD